MATVRINNNDYQADVSPDTPLLWVLRDVLGLTGTKFGCGIAECGACTVHVDGEAVRACSLPIGDLGTKSVTTIEGLEGDRLARAIQDAWADIDVVQCGYCQPGQIMSAIALLKNTPHPTDAQIDASMSGNICRCGTYPRIRQAIRNAAGDIA